MFDILCGRGPIDEVHKAALTHLAAELMNAGDRLDRAADSLFRVAGIEVAEASDTTH